ncbi:MAG: trypsin-like peptidase domain-containing protein [Candidatus Gastranaerophilales bacterium]|nr:trypsin-like peptidase domain-containing protein [Candidatus Gastranaerophilales bacterium]
MSNLRTSVFKGIFSVCLLSVSLAFSPISPALAFSGDEIVNISIYEKINPCIVAVDGAITEEEFSSGTGCIINPEGYILTSRHVIDGVNEIKVTLSDGSVLDAKIIKSVGEGNDLAILKINAKKPLTPITFGSSSKVKVGQKVLALGNPFGFNNTLTTGIVSRVDAARNKIQTDAAINPGSSGGPLLNTEGEVIGINQSIYNPDNNKSNIGIGFAVPVDTAVKFIESNRKYLTAR